MDPALKDFLVAATGFLVVVTTLLTGLNTYLTNRAKKEAEASKTVGQDNAYRLDVAHEELASNTKTTEATYKLADGRYDELIKKVAALEERLAAALGENVQLRKDKPC